jgi:hypothetical protein
MYSIPFHMEYLLVFHIAGHICLFACQRNILSKALPPYGPVWNHEWPLSVHEGPVPTGEPTWFYRGEAPVDHPARRIRPSGNRERGRSPTLPHNPIILFLLHKR